MRSDVFVIEEARCEEGRMGLDLDRIFGPLRIAMIAPPYLAVPPTGYGGIEQVVSALTEGLVAAGHDVTLFAAPGSVTSARLVSPLNAPIPLGDPAGLSDELYHITSAYREAHSFDVIHDHTGMGPTLGSMLLNPPIVHTLHGPWTDKGRRMARLLHDRVHLVGISNAQRKDNVEIRYAGVVYNGISLAAHVFREKKEDYLVFVGRINPEKRPEVAIEIARKAGLPLVMVIKRSEPFERLYFDDVVAPLLGADITVLDEPAQQVKIDIVSRARALLFPIDWPEPFGLVMTEAMACGTPVIARALGSVPEIVRDGITGFCCSSTQEMVEAVGAVALLSPRDCREDVERRFSAPVMVAGYERVYRLAIARTRRLELVARSTELLLLGEKGLSA
jgi:glycosyltransferase involved in cell wall biosynthesis